jgi:hypothetical protein
MPTLSNSWRARSAATVATILLALAPGATAAATAHAGGDEDPWRVLAALRAELTQAGPLTARFVQTFVATGFDEGDEEAGGLAMSLPRCLRWDYGEPFPKSFLLCDLTSYYWNPGETSGQRYPIEDEEAPGLDFFLRTPDELEARYEAHLAALERGLVRIDLVPREPIHEVVALHLLVEVESNRLRELSYEDADGNRTRFELFDYAPGADAALFEPPAGMQWEEP